MRATMMVLVGSLMAMPGVASAQQAPAAASAKAGKAKADPNRIVCRTDDSTGSRLRKTRTCRTAAEWTAAMNATDRRDVERAQATRWRSDGS